MLNDVLIKVFVLLNRTSIHSAKGRGSPLRTSPRKRKKGKATKSPLSARKLSFVVDNDKEEVQHVRKKSKTQEESPRKSPSDINED